MNAPAGAALGQASDAVIARGRGSLGDSSTQVDVAAGQWVHAFSSRMHNDLRAQFARDSERESPRAPLPQEPAIGPGGLAQMCIRDSNGAGGISYIPFLGRNTLKLKRDIVDDLRVLKGFKLTERYNLELRADLFNVANHQNVTSAGTTAYVFSSAGSTAPLIGTATYQPSTFGVPTSVNSSGFLYTPREIQISARFAF